MLCVSRGWQKFLVPRSLKLAYFKLRLTLSTPPCMQKTCPVGTMSNIVASQPILTWYQYCAEGVNPGDYTVCRYIRLDPEQQESYQSTGAILCDHTCWYSCITFLQPFSQRPRHC